MNELALTRSRAKHPPHKTVTEANRIKDRVTNSNRKEQNMAIRTKLEDLPPLARKYVEENEGGMMLTAAEDRPATPTEMRDLESRIDGAEREREADRRERQAERDARIASEVDAKATSLMNSDPSLDYSAAVRRVVADGEHFLAPEEPAQSGESLADAVERRMKADPANYPDSSGDDDSDQVGSVHRMDQGDYETQMKQIMKERGYDD